MNFLCGIGAIIGGVVAGVLALLLIIFMIWIISTYNSFVRLKNNIEEAFSTMDVYLKKRYDLIPNLVETVKGYAKHEKETLEKVIAARNACAQAGNMEDKLASEKNLSSVLKQLAVVIEKYPELKADKNFTDLQNTLKQLENEIASSRKYFNGVTKTYNTKREVFPSNIIARWFKFDKKPLFEVDNAIERKNVKVEF
ncbi:MAG: LemA family protein [Christensenellales bacterium]